MNCILIHVAGGLQELYPITEGVVSIGRESDNDIQLLDETASRHHARINNHTSVCEIEDLESNNGVFVNGTKVQRHSLKHSDEIKFGSTILRFEQVNYEISSDNAASNRDYSARSQHATIKVQPHPSAIISPKKQTAAFPTLRLKKKPQE